MSVRKVSCRTVTGMHRFCDDIAPPAMYFIAKRTSKSDLIFIRFFFPDQMQAFLSFSECCLFCSFSKVFG